MNWKVLRVLFLSVFAAMLGQGVVVPLLPDYAHQLGASNFEIGFIFSAFSLSTLIFLPLFGRWSDRKGRKFLITGGLALYAGAAVAYMAVSSVNSLVLVRFSHGIAAAMILPVARAYAGEITPANKAGFAMGLINLFFFGGVASGPLLGGMVRDAFGLHYAFLLMAVVCLCGAAMSHLMLPTGGTETRPPGRKCQGATAGWFGDRHIAGLFIVLLGSNISTAVIWAFAPFIAQVNLHLPARMIGLMITGSVLITALLNIPLGYLADRLRKGSLLATGILTLSAALFLLPMAQTPWNLWTVCVVAGFGVGITHPLANAMAIHWGREKRRLGATMSIMATATNLGMLCGPLIVGYLFDFYSPGVAFWSAGAIVLALGMAGWIMVAV